MGAGAAAERRFDAEAEKTQRSLNAVTHVAVLTGGRSGPWRQHCTAGMNQDGCDFRRCVTGRNAGTLLQRGSKNKKKTGVGGASAE